jgi:hypothetical protein
MLKHLSHLPVSSPLRSSLAASGSNKVTARCSRSMSRLARSSRSGTADQHLVNAPSVHIDDLETSEVALAADPAHSL